MQNYIAVDIGASSGRLIYGKKENDQLTLQEIHRFENGFIHENGHDCWDIDYLIEEVFKGLEKAKKLGIHEAKLGIDTWAVDYVLIGQDGKKLKNPISYRDKRTVGVIEEFSSIISKEEIYQKTGIQFLEFNTLFQLFKEDRGILKRTDKILLIPDYISYILTGRAVTEVTNASTTQMLNLKTRKFDRELLSAVGVSENQFPPLIEAGTVIGPIKKEWYEKFDIPKCEVIAVATHDTASAVVGTPGIGKNWAYISSGTWSLLGAELNQPENGVAAYNANYTNEWGAYGTYRFLKNIMGMWMIQSVRRNLNDKYSYEEMALLAEEVQPFQQFIDVNDSRFINPDNMINAIQSYCEETKQKVPETIGEIVAAIYSNLALYYAHQIKELENITGREIDTINIVGGGSNVDILNQLTSTLSKKVVYAGPNEATAIGNLLVQIITAGELENVQVGRKLVRNSFMLKNYIPESSDRYDQVLKEYEGFIKNRLQLKEDE